MEQPAEQAPIRRLLILGSRIDTKNKNPISCDQETGFIMRYSLKNIQAEIE